ncbi:MAG: SusD/RagB family nutrient-binding outer membrane lipoprotein [Cyclobacteriaceae bacterium]|nr:SusD/RagB family nutrient-binding outer membrane lipoprotein [Cyclobacteriaceae bacterium]
MKILNKILVITAAMIVGVFQSCSDDKLDEIGTNPNNPTEVPIKLLIPQVTVETAFAVSGTDLAWYSSVFVEHTTGVHGQLETADKRTGINSTIGNNSWNSLYSVALANLNIIIERGSEGGAEEGYWNAVGIAKILMAYNYSIATDLWGEIPYSEALQGKENRTPMFDSQETVYTGIQELLDEAITDLQKESLTNVGATDFFYNGNSDAWIKAAYALKARYYNHLSRKDPEGTANSVLSAIANAFEDNSESLVFKSFTTDATGQHPWFQESNDRSHHAVSQTIYDITNDLGDPRADIWFGTIEGVVAPAPNGTATTDQSGTIYSRASQSYITATAPLPIITYDELKFLEAEANLRLNKKPEAYAAYLEGVESALERANVESDDITAYLAKSTVDVGENSLTLENIITQKYVSFWLFQPIEAYNDYRRTMIPEMHNTVGPPPNRFPYPQDEVAANPNVPERTIQNKVWWAE